MHPFLKDDFLFDWSPLKPAAIEPDIREALRRARANVDAFKQLTGPALTYDNVLLGFESATRELGRGWIDASVAVVAAMVLPSNAGSGA